MFMLCAGQRTPESSLAETTLTIVSMTLYVKRKDGVDGREDYYKYGDAIEENGFLMVFDFNDKKPLARYPMDNVAQWRTA
jgi:hypothetical protein